MSKEYFYFLTNINKKKFLFPNIWYLYFFGSNSPPYKRRALFWYILPSFCSHLIINIFWCPLCDIKQIMTSVSILSCFMPFLGYRDNEIGPLALFLSLYARKGIKQDRIYTLVTICIIYHSTHIIYYNIVDTNC